MSHLQKTISLLPHGALVLYENDGVPLLALICGFKKDKYLVFNERGREVELPAQRIIDLKSKGPGSAAPQGEKLSYLSTTRTTAETKASEVDVPELWNFVHEEPREYSDEELASLFFGTVDLSAHLGTRLALLADKVYFKRTKHCFEPRPKETIDELKKAEDAKKRKQQLQQLTVDIFRTRLDNPDLPIPAELMPNLTLLEEYAAQGTNLDGPRQREASELLALAAGSLNLHLGGPGEEQAFKLLVAIGHFHEDTNLSFIRHKPLLHWPDAALEEARSLALPSPLTAPDRLDLTALRTITIDDQTTHDMDDAISIEHEEGGYRLGIHITDVASVIPFGGPLDRAARHRATSIYCPERTVNMLPDDLAEQTLSLVEGQVRPALTCLFSLDRDFRVLSGTLHASFIRVTERLSYDSADDLLHNGNPELDLLYNIASALEAERIRSGGSRIEKREAFVYPMPDGSLRLMEIDEASPARSLVGEMMILCNNLIAQYAVRHHFALPFRGQEQPEDQGAPDVPTGPAYDYAMRSRLKRSTVSTSPTPHASLGLEAYTQVSSPIRRYLDLCAQRQVLHHLQHGTPLFSAEEFEGIIQEVEQPLSVANAVSRESKRYWMLRYLEERARTNPLITGTIIRVDQRVTLAELEEVYIPGMVKSHAKVRPGDVVNLRIARVDPRADYLRLEVI
jgi:exoribonuclease II